MNITIHPTAPKYVNKKGNTVFRYIVKGTPAELLEYKAIKGENHREDTILKEPLFFSTRYAGNKAELRKTSDGKDVVVDDTEMVMFQSLVAQYGIDTALFMWKKENVKEPVQIEGQK